jgi:chloride channel protein, CIC family
MFDIERKIQYFRRRYLQENEYIYLLAIGTGIFSGSLAVLMKNTVHWLSFWVENTDIFNGVLLYLSPIVGVAATVLLAKYVMKMKTGHGIPKVLYAISRRNASIGQKNILSSSLFSVLTVGFGGSAGLEGPSASAGAAVGSQMGRLLSLEYRQMVVMVGCGSTAAISAMFNTPIAAILFSLEVLMLNLGLLSIVPLLIASVTGQVVAYFFLGQETFADVGGGTTFMFEHLPIYLILGVLASINSIFFSKIYHLTEKLAEKIPGIAAKIAIGGAMLFGLYFLFPSLYGEGYQIINKCIASDTGFATKGMLFSNVSEPIYIAGLIFAIMILKTFATNITFGMGGVGGIFAPSLFIGAVTGLFSTYILRLMGFTDLPVATIVLVSMSGFMTGILHAPLTSIFLIAEVTRGYELMVPLIITSVISFFISRKYMKHSVYTFELAKRNQLMTHDKNKSVLAKIALSKILETNFVELSPDDGISEIINAIKRSKRNVFPVTDSNGLMAGILTFDDLKRYVFDTHKHQQIKVSEIMYKPATVVNIGESIGQISKKIHDTGRYNIPVLDNGMYLGFVSRANLFSEFQREIENLSMED